jgi:hypothetical protein
MKDSEEIRRTKREHSLSLLCTGGVVDVGIGKKRVRGQSTEATSITILVREKARRSVLPAKDILPKQIDGVPTDVISLGGTDPLLSVRLRQSPTPKNERTKRWRPAPAGVSVGHYLLNGAGTLGGWVLDSRSGEPLVLSCWHVIANSGLCKKGDPVLQPAVLDGGRLPDDIIAYLERWIDVQMIVSTHDVRHARQRLKCLLRRKLQVPANYIDAALARPVSDSVVSHEILGLGAPATGAIAAKLGIEVAKSGRTTGTTAGVIGLTDLDIFVEYPTGIALFADQIAMLPLTRAQPSPKLSATSPEGTPG